MENSKEKFPKRKIFQFVQKKLATLGITRALAAQPYPLHGRLLFGFLALIAILVMMILYPIYENMSFFEYTQSAYAISLEIMTIFFWLIIILQANTLFEFIDDSERLANTCGYSN